MSDLVVTVPKWFFEDWIDEGDAAGDPPTGETWGFSCGSARYAQPPIQRGERLYVVAHDKLRGYAPVTKVVAHQGKWWICREGGAVACTIAEPIKGFRGWRKRWWEREQEQPFPDWRAP